MDVWICCQVYSGIGSLAVLHPDAWLVEFSRQHRCASRVRPIDDPAPRVVARDLPTPMASRPETAGLVADEAILGAGLAAGVHKHSRLADVACCDIVGADQDAGATGNGNLQGPTVR